ncbi:hypothetical protein NE865_10711 [Phthorimaea operculella]|nr:hypothetical protein NE865_10711 [Phthorimaea operculella]
MSKRTAQEQILHYQRKLRKLEESEKLRLLEALNTQPSEKTANSQQNGSTRNEEKEENNAPAQEMPKDNEQTHSQSDGTNDSSTQQTNQKSSSADQAVHDHDLTSDRADPPPTAAATTDEPSSLPPPIELETETAEDAATIDMIRNRDKKLEAAQQQLGVGISAINKALTMLLTCQDKVSAIKHISDGCRILADLHYLNTQARIKMVTPVLAKPFLSIIQESERDETLFGKSLPDKIKASKAIEKQGLQIKKSAPNPKNNPTAGSSSTAFRANQYQGNWQAPPRFPSNKGGRGGQRKPTTAGPARRQAPPPQSRPAGQSKSRAAAQQ